MANYGFYANPAFTLKQNFNKTLRENTPNLSQQPTNLAFHNICSINNTPSGLKDLLGLNLKYCIASNQTNQDVNKMMQKLAYSIRTHCHLKDANLTNSSDYVKQIYSKNKHWNPPPAPIIIENKLTELEKALKREQKLLTSKHRNRSLRNLMQPQISTLRALRNNNNLIIKPSDKNLGPVVMNTEHYITEVLSKHLLTKDYKQLSETEVHNKMEQVRNHLESMINDHQYLLSKAELTYFKRNLREWHRLPIFYGLSKVHKIPTTLRPVIVVQIVS
jgi:hypothetical protein